MSEVIVVVSIGRCVGSQPMDSMSWLRFKQDTLNITEFSAVPKGILQRPDLSAQRDLGSTQYGVWEGVACEDAAVVMAIVPMANVPMLRNRLSVLAHKYQQDAIGLIVHNAGTDTLCPARTTLGDI